jgi:2-keto-3-deoxy-L-rhamnonate aldolase RhmA
MEEKQEHRGMDHLRGRARRWGRESNFIRTAEKQCSPAVRTEQVQAIGNCNMNNQAF